MEEKEGALSTDSGSAWLAGGGYRRYRQGPRARGAAWGPKVRPAGGDTQDPVVLEPKARRRGPARTRPATAAFGRHSVVDGALHHLVVLLA